MDEGYVAKILVEAGKKDISVGVPVLVLVEDKDSISKFENFSADAAAAPTEAVKPAESAPAPAAVSAAPAAAAPVLASASAASSGERVLISPLAKKLAASEGIDLNQMAANSSATGPNGRFREADVTAFIQRIKSGEFAKVAEVPSAAAPAAASA